MPAAGALVVFWSVSLQSTVRTRTGRPGHPGSLSYADAPDVELHFFIRYPDNGVR